jgi:hypothetical protein
MISIARNLGKAIPCLVAILCTACLSASLPKTAKVEPTPPLTETTTKLDTNTLADKNLLNRWELLYRVTESGEKETPRDNTRTLIEFTDGGQVIFNRLDKDHSDQIESRTGKFTVEGDMINIVDDMGNSVAWPYQLTGESLIIVMPELKKKFYWRRFR